jgi:putative (di)nucleoside polyphosphate hydrolase
MKLPRQYFRAGVGAVITDGRGRVLVFERHSIPGAWQFPQGGMEEGEEPIDTAYREITEETGIPKRALRLLARHPDLLAYEVPPRARSSKTGRGQVQHWFLFRIDPRTPLTDPPEDSEFRARRWASFDSAVRHVVGFKRPLYRKLRAQFGRAAGRARRGHAKRR